MRTIERVVLHWITVVHRVLAPDPGRRTGYVRPTFVLASTGGEGGMNERDERRSNQNRVITSAAMAKNSSPGSTEMAGDQFVHKARLPIGEEEAEHLPIQFALVSVNSGGYCRGIMAARQGRIEVDPTIIVATCLSESQFPEAQAPERLR
ncbi:MAG: hypothetical protein U1G07_01655 [Verrucomicrobiota bacterium]